METWRITATVLFVVGGLILTLVAMAQVRDRKHTSQAAVVQAGLISVAVVAVLAILVATLLSSTWAWALVAAEAIAVLFLMLAG
ncbi:small neutral amino acid transporter SnatA (MarC family) [Crossiella equi]|uniref:Small neutral amino acid transporter SnatA (MarC family) n=1 Tax=Crossiella equi TaxID=130796 RepID=A0ABS5AFC8_9PSEU|nr:hypothetical protein [Crossiella equi]MBP2475290.1 small neutral amino acid transporter SnatA (MarC family) [Crossiella equi]